MMEGRGPRVQLPGPSPDAPGGQTGVHDLPCPARLAILRFLAEVEDGGRSVSC